MMFQKMNRILSKNLPRLNIISSVILVEDFVVMLMTALIQKVIRILLLLRRN